MEGSVPSNQTRGHSRKRLELAGQRYGQLTVLAPAENVNGRTAWRCRCGCGRETVVRTHHLRSGHTKSCGCLAAGEPGLAGLTYVGGTCVEMLASGTVRRNNTSGVPGVDWRAGKQRWRATICFQGKRRYLGSYAEFEDAVKARKRAEEMYFETFLAEYERSARAAEGADDDGGERGARDDRREIRPTGDAS